MDSELPVFALAWVTCEGEPLTPMGQGGRILFVEHPQRGWEIPGGHLEEHEQPEDALLRELKEETGMIGRLVSWNKTYYPKGWVGHVVVPPTEKSSWTVRDEKVAAVKWWGRTPPVIEWTEEEFEELANYFSIVKSE
ncbi:MAG: NUDIX domain-containing protein [Euryarchaeota archaeon]|jgi:8-oxo-dGTP diphosphatase|nr:NUDIX domain-containing protein [Euryarchaeota archaeon]